LERSLEKREVRPGSPQYSWLTGRGPRTGEDTWEAAGEASGEARGEAAAELEG